MEEDTSNNHRRHRQIKTLAKADSLTTTDGNTVANLLVHSSAEGGADVEKSEMWNAFSDNFDQVQAVLDRNRVLIQQVNDNHQSKMHDNLVKNVSLIQEINGNINKVVSLYSDLSVNFSSMCHHQRNTPIQSKDGDGKLMTAEDEQEQIS
ncbi:OLC1v1026798C1 [Oldenlandia corymbosa var. corymbosa]|uniref:OLC1v1026798C1 n=1 Tax=Oldenlandia corymbosa var. corymbosa TaxID=529605 RepID=A0AAV1C8G5_OLDCO|nr:OLC1v1026798C1 [Oldenlandia corymbosa var. corymbosa]